MLSMVNPRYDACLARALRDTAADSVVCVVDFHSSPFAWFRRWMAMNHVRMESQMCNDVLERGEPFLDQERSGLLGFWRYRLVMARP